ncbi:hypothetical protein HPB50_024943 [Hyalomma asiaticum]|uniref:Uncharacterized protein n=1 Tax=Hyalomma asiaticum TaxID=266040 RepID=A0ACB7TQI4_HYAAI|nr:hypothetical protein HPB50_024943 [Hyalomma asiaticum]
MLRTLCTWHTRRRPSGDPRTKVGACNDIPATHKADHGGGPSSATGDGPAVCPPPANTPHLRLSGKQRAGAWLQRPAQCSAIMGARGRWAANDDRWVPSD